MPTDFLRLPVGSAGAEHLVMGYLMRRDILGYKAPMNKEGDDLICIHPDPRHVPRRGQKSQVRVQVKSRYATDCDRGFPGKEKSFDAFDFLVAAFLNVGTYGRERTGEDAMTPVEFFTLPNEVIREHQNTHSSWQKVLLKKLQTEIEPFRDEGGFELIAEALGMGKPAR